MSERIVLKDDIDQQYNQLSELTGSFSTCSDLIKLKLCGITDSFRRSGGKTTIINLCEKHTRIIDGLIESLREGTELLRISRDTLRNLDAVLRDNANNTEFPGLNNLSYGDTASEQKVYEYEEDYWVETKEQLPYDPNTGKDLGWCAGYAYARYNYLHPGLLPNPPGDAKFWLKNNENNPPLKVVRGGWDLLNNSSVNCPCIGVTINGNYGHVIIIEKVTYNADGSIKDIYWSESNGEYDTQTHPNGFLDPSNSFFTKGVDGVMNKYSFASGEKMPWVLSSLNGIIYCE